MATIQVKIVAQVYKMPIDTQLSTCAEQYSRWKKLALDARTLPEMKECLNKALFWLELHTAFVALWSIEQTRGRDPTVKRHLITAKANLSKKLTEYAQKSLDELNWK